MQGESMFGRSNRLGLVTALLVVTAVAVPIATAVAAEHVEVVATFDEPSEGVAVDKTGNVFVSLTFSGRLLKFAKGSSDYEVFGEIPGWGGPGTPGAGFLGLAVDATGNVYGTAQWEGSTGVYRFDRKTGDASLIPGTGQISFPNSLAFDKTGNLYVTDTNSTGVMNPLNGQIPLGAVWRIGRDGTVEKWVEDPMLGGSGIAGAATPLGANGIAYRQGTLYVANTEKSTILSIPVGPGGSAGPISVVAELPPLDGIPGVPFPFPAIPDGIALDVHGNIYVAVVAQSAIARVSPSGDVEILAQDPDGALLDFPSSLAFGTGAGMKDTLYVVNLAIGPPGRFGPALLTLDVGMPGMPLP